MITRNSLRAIALTTGCLMPMVAFADDPAPALGMAPPAAPLQISGFAGIGLMGVFGHNPDQAGRYTGLNTNGLDIAITDFDVLGRSAWNSGGVRYYPTSTVRTWSYRETRGIPWVSRVLMQLWC